MTWWNTSWLYKKQIALTETSGTTLSNYSVKVNVTATGSMNSDFSDLRFLDSTETTELGYWIESYVAGSSAVVWVKIPTLTASSVTNIFMYYGNSGATTTSNGNNAFLLFDDFSVDTSSNYTDYEWDSSSSVTYGVSGGTLNVSAQAYHTTALKSNYNTTLSTTNGFEIDGDFLSTGANWGALGLILGTNYVSGSQDSIEGIILTDGGSKTEIQKHLSGTRTTATSDSSLTFSTNVWYNLKLRVANQNWSILVDDVLKGSSSITDSAIYGNVNPGFKFRPYTSGYTMKADNLRMRNYISPEPTYTIGAEQTQSVQFTKTSDSRILIQSQKTKDSTARLQINNLQNVYDGISRLKVQKTLNKNSNSRILINQSFQKTANSKIKITHQFTKTSNARIVVNQKQTKDGTATIKNTIQINKNSNADILIKNSLNKDSTARISIQNNFNRDGTAFILKGGIFPKTSNARIKIQQSKTKNSNSRISIQNNFNKISNSRIKKDNQFIKTSNAKIFFQKEFNKISNARIKKDNKILKTANANIKILTSFTKTAEAKIVYETIFTKDGSSFILIPDTFKPQINILQNLKPKIKTIETFN